MGQSEVVREDATMRRPESLKGSFRGGHLPRLAPDSSFP